MNRFAIYPFPFGQLKIGYENNAVTLLRKTEAPASPAGRTSLTGLAYQQVMEYLSGQRRSFDFPYRLTGTDFQQRVWQALCKIPYGQTATYKEIAAAVGNPNACRAVGMANNRNPITMVVPCHRVIGASGKLVGYAGGLEMKQALLSLERRTAGTEAPRR